MSPVSDDSIFTALSSQISALGTSLGQEFAGVHTTIGEIRADLASVRTDLNCVKQDLIVVKADVADLMSDVSVLKQDMILVKSKVLNGGAVKEKEITKRWKYTSILLFKIVVITLSILGGGTAIWEALM